MGNKYIIEIENDYRRTDPFNVEGPLRLYRVSGFNSLVFDEEGLKRLEKYDPNEEYDRGFEWGYANAKTENELPSGAEACGYEKGYEKGLSDAWEAAKNLVDDLYNPDVEQLEILEKYRLTVHWADSLHEMFFAKGPEYAIESLRLWKEKNEEIRVGDEVIVNGLMGVVMKLDEKGNVDRYFTCDGKTFGNISGFQNNEVKKTGRHFPEVAELLEKMKEVEE